MSKKLTPKSYINSPAGQAFIAKTSNDIFYDPFETRSVDDLKSRNKIADEILCAVQAGSSIDDAIVAAYRINLNDDNCEYGEARRLAVNHCEQLVEEEEIPAGKEDLFSDALTDALLDHVREDYDSSVRDAVSSHDLCEVVFLFGVDPNQPTIDQMVDKPDWIEETTPSLNRALRAMGLTIQDFAACLAVQNRSAKKFITRIEPSATLDAAFWSSHRRAPIIDAKTLSQLVDETWGYPFHFCAYAQIPIRALLDFRPGDAFTLSKAAIAVYDPHNGCFFDAKTVENLSLSPTDGHLVTPSGWYSPDDICDHVSSYYKATLSQDSAPVPPVNNKITQANIAA